MADTTSTPRLIIVDGFAGSGKSTTAQRLWLQLHACGRQAFWFHEHQSGHPIFRYDEVEELLDLTPGPFEDQILANWTAFARDAAAPAIRILDGSFFQLTVGVMLSLNVTPRRIERTLLQIERLVSGVEPLLIYLFHRSTRDGLLNIRTHRGEYWLDGMTTILGRSRYGRRHRVRDLDGLIAFYEKQRAIVDSVLGKLAIRRIAIEISRGRWDEYGRRMAAFLRMGRLRPLTLSPKEALRHVGRFTGTTTGREYVVTTDAASLYLQDRLTPAQRLLPAGGGLFSVESLPIDVRFAADRRGEVRRMIVDNRLLNGQAAARSFTRRRETRSS